ncbi:MAG: DUF3892 domain-containing protein [Pseudomonadota bacterium]
MSLLRIEWIIPDQSDPDRRIDAVGGDADNFCHILDTAIYNIKYGIHSYYTIVGLQRVAVEVATRNRREYLKTVADYYEPNNLLSLPHRRWAA